MKAAFTPGTTFANYRVESLLGRGGMGVVYLARDLSLDRRVALKLIAPELADDDQFRARFLREPKLAASLDHPNVIPIYEAGEHEGQLYLAMRFVEGSDLRTLLDRDGKLSPERTLAILTQVAGALDAAHRRALVHRDMKPANVLLDEDGHAYLTDFGITKQLGGASTDTGRMVGTLDYLAPEQIRGEPVDGRTDSYALACVLYECLAGKPPFRRGTEAETMWAHMQDQPVPLRGRARLDPVLRKALAKDREDRYRSCAELIADTASALGLELPGAPPRPVVPHALRRRAPVLLVVGGLVLAVAAGLAILAMTGGGDGKSGPIGNGVAAIDPADGSVTSFTESEAPPGNVAVGEDGVWVLNNEAKTVSRIDPDTREVTVSFDTPGVPSELAVGEGALWVGIAGGRGDGGANATVRVAQMDPDDGRITGTARLRGDEGVYPVAGTPRLAVGKGAVWAANPDGSVSRIDAKSGRVVATIETKNVAWTIAAGDEGVWYLGFDGPTGVTEIDTRRNRQGRTIPVGASGLMGVAVGGGSVWAAADQDGVVWRIVPDRSAGQRTIDVGRGATFVTFGEGAVWTGNYVDGKVARIDPRTNKVTAKASVGAPQALAAGAGSAWVSVAGETTEGALSRTTCNEVASGAGTPDVLIASDLVLQGPASSDSRAMEGAIRHVIERRGFKAGDHTVGYQSCDASTPQTGNFEFRKCAANASAYAHAKQLVAVIGPYSSFCGQVQIPITNRAPGGPLAMVSAVSTHTGLTRGGPLAQEGRLGRGEPAVYYPTGERSFVRLMAPEYLQGVANAMLAKELGLKGVYVLQDPGWKVEFSDPFRRTAARLGIQIAGVANFSDDSNHDRLAERVARSGAQGVFIAGLGSEGGGRLVIALRERLGSRIKILAHDPFLPIAEMLDFAGPAAHGLYFSSTDVPPRAQPPAGRRFARDIGTFNTPVFGVLPAGQTAELVLDAIAHSDGTRASVLEELRGAKVGDGILGDFRIDRYGDITPARLAVFRITGATPPSAPVFPQYEGAVFDRVIEVPANLARP
jgi:ABC-type branched-subunit amino acid transport system substrate-binding protein/predicted Ser/Thr protein kinase